jgi:hypothetical protein
MSSPRFIAFPILAVAAIYLVALSPVAAQQHAGEHVESANELQATFDSAAASAKVSDGLDPAYDLLGIAGSAQARGMKPLGDKASAAFVDLVQRSAAVAQRKGGSLARDTLDQLIDLRFFARSQDVAAAMAGIDTALRGLFPFVAQAVEKRFDTATEWDEKLDALNDLASLQAAATQVLMNDLAGTTGAAFDTRLAAVQDLANQPTDETERGRRLNGVAESKRSREEQIADAKANNVETVANLKASGRTEESTRGNTGESVSPELMGETSCIETGYRPGIAATQQRTHDRECVNSGRLPSTQRCPVANLSLACYQPLTNGEKIIYAYRNTPEEGYFRSKCAKDDVIPGNKVPPSGAPFRAPDVSLAFTCAPSAGADATAD